MIIHDFKETEYDELIKDGIVLVDFFATWCGPCKMLAPELEALVKKRNDVKVLSVDVDKHESISMRYRIMSVPTLLLYYKGELLGNRSGYMPLNILDNWINELVK